VAPSLLTKPPNANRLRASVHQRIGTLYFSLALILIILFGAADVDVDPSNILNAEFVVVIVGHKPTAEQDGRCGDEAS
jgi:hypothetical protein